MCFFPDNALDAYWGMIRNDMAIPERYIYLNSISSLFMCFLYDIRSIPFIFLEDIREFPYVTKRQAALNIFLHLKKSVITFIKEIKRRK